MMYCEAIASQLGALFVCTPHDKYVRIRTPFMYPDGDIVDLFVRDIGGTTLVTDLGESLRWLRSQTINNRRSTKQSQLLNDVCMTLGLELFRGMLMLRVPTEGDIAAAIMRVGQGAVRASDLWFTQRTRALQSTSDEVAEFLTEQRIDYTRGARHLGRSNHAWTIDFQVFAKPASSYVFVLTSGSRTGARSVVEHTLAAMYDLSHVQASGVGFVSLFDDTEDVWNDKEFALLSEFSKLARWANPQSLIDAIQHVN
jgi:hypothetical protein